LVAALSVWAGHRLTQQVKKDHTSFSPRLKDFVYLIYAFLFLLFAAAIEGITNNLGYRWVTTVSLIIVLVAVRATRSSDDPLQNSTDKENDHEQ